MSPATATSGLAVVQNLYVLQMELANYSDEDLRDPATRKEATQKLKQFSELLDKANPAYMGDDEVMATLKTLLKEVREKIKKAK